MDFPQEGDFRPIRGSICRRCLQDPGLIKIWWKGPRKSSKCKYCDDKKSVLPIAAITPVIHQFIDYHYNSAADESPWDDGAYVAPTYTSQEVLENLVGGVVCDGLFEDLVEASDEQALYCERDWALLRQHEVLAHGWQEFCKAIKHRRRFLFQHALDEDARFRGANEIPPGEFLRAIGKTIRTMRIKRALRAGTILYRARIMRRDVDRQTITARDLYAPPDQCATYANRFSPAGISMFYGAYDKATAMAEIGKLSDADHRYVVAQFRLRVDMDILDWRSARFPAGNFDVDSLNRYPLAQFFRLMVADMAQPVTKDGREHVDYVPTQVVSEFVRSQIRRNRRPCQGMVYASVAHPGGANAVLFLDHDACADAFDCDNIIVCE